ncbi:MAG: response regulator transcription factor [Geodermatophilaceae bacterium]|nr:response regulator transcription factor [Geodermatophilaceae bacterium]MDQ3466196.1 response regulator transcription factor [Actinomycetota bacterium]
MSAILIAEDEPRIAAFVAKGLAANGFSTVIVDNGVSAAALARDEEFSLMVLDLGLPGKNGMAVLAEIRQRGERMPVVILTARDEMDLTVAGFETGADDYMTKPFRFEELLARVRARLRVDRMEEPTLLRVGDIILDLRTRRVTTAGQTIELTAREFALAETFLRHPDQVLSRQQLLSSVWGYDFDPGSNVVDVYVRYLRRKLGSSVIETVRNMGYRLVVRR